MLYSSTAMSNSGQGYWECLRVGGTHTRDTEGKEKICRSIPALSFLPVFALSVAGKLNGFDKIKMGSISRLVDFKHIYLIISTWHWPKYLPSLCTSPQPSSMR
jgi:hypothetical protein